MEKTYVIEEQPSQNRKRSRIFVKYKLIAVVGIVALAVVVSLMLLGAFLGPGRKHSSSGEYDHSEQALEKKDKQTKRLACDVAIIGGGISGLYVAETLLRLQKETDVCLFERDDWFGGRIRDHTFRRMPGVPVSLGAWRVDESHSTVWELLKRFNKSVSYLTKNDPDILEARGVFANDSLTLKKKAFHSLNQGRFQNATYTDIMRYLLSHGKEADKFASLSDFMSEYLTPEGYQFFVHKTGLMTDYYRKYDAAVINDLLTAKAYFKNNFSRPDSGLSSVTQELLFSAVNLGAKVYKNEEIKVMERTQGTKFKLITRNFTVKVNKLVVAIPPAPLKQIKGSVAEMIQNDSIFQTIGWLMGFKGFAVFEEAWWQIDSAGSRYLSDERQMMSTSDCLGFIFPYKQRGTKGEAVLQMSYAMGGCAVKWGELLKMSKEAVDREMYRALSRLFPRVDIPKPLESEYIYWSEGMAHLQRGGTHLSSFKLADWAKRPFPKQELFLVGEAYQPMRGWMEGALQSAQNALREGWNINIRVLRKEREMPQESPDQSKLNMIHTFP